MCEKESSRAACGVGVLSYNSAAPFFTGTAACFSVPWAKWINAAVFTTTALVFHTFRAPLFSRMSLPVQLHPRNKVFSKPGLTACETSTVLSATGRVGSWTGGGKEGRLMLRVSSLLPGHQMPGIAVWQITAFNSRALHKLEPNSKMSKRTTSTRWSHFTALVMSCWGRAQKPPLGVGGIKPGHRLFRVAEPSRAKRQVISGELPGQCGRRSRRRCPSTFHPVTVLTRSPHQKCLVSV